VCTHENDFNVYYLTDYLSPGCTCFISEILLVYVYEKYKYDV